MKKLFLVLLMVILTSSLILSACAEPAPAPAPAPAPTPTPAPTPAPAPETFELKFAGWAPEGDEMHLALQQWMPEVEELTGGRVKVTPYYAQSLSKATEMLDNLESGVCDIASVATSYYADRLPISGGILSLPGMAPNRFMSTEILYTLWNRGLLDREFADYKPLWLQAAEPSYLFTIDKKVKTLEELKGMKIRSFGVQSNLNLEALGASPVGIPMPELFQALSTGVVDGLITAPGLFLIMKLQDVVKNCLWGLPISAGGVFNLMSREKWESFPTDIKLVMEQCDAKAKYQFIELAEQAFPHDPGILRQVGVEDYTLSPEEAAPWLEAMGPVYDQWLAEMEAKGLPGQEALDTARQILAISEH